MTELDHTQLRRASRALRRWCLTCARNIVTGEASAAFLQYRKSDGTLSEPVRLKDKAHLVIRRCHARARNHGLTFIHNTDIDQPQVWLAKGDEMIAIY